MTQIQLSDIDWDCEDKNTVKELPKSMLIDVFEIPDHVWQTFETAIEDYLAEKYSFCVRGYSWEFTKSITD